MLVGRHVELGLLGEALDAGRDRGALVVLEGEAGIGKTALLEAAVAQAPGSGPEVLWARAEELGRHQPLSTFAGALGLSSASSPAAGEAALAAVEQRCAAGRVALVVEDLQWADAASLLVLHRLARALPTLGLTLICSCRPVPRRPQLRHLLASLAHRQGTWLPVGPLAEEACRSLAEALLGAPPGPRLCCQLARTGGNPLFVVEVVAALRREEAIEVGTNGVADLRRSARAPSLPVTILHRLSLLQTTTRELLGLAAVLGTSFSVEDLALVSGRSALRLWPVLREALEGGVLAEDGERLVFRHGLIRDTLYADIAAPVRASLHAQVARCLDASGAPATQVAEHLARGTRPDDAEVAVRWHRVAADVAGHAPALAAPLWERALPLLAPGDPVGTEAAAGLAVALLALDRLPEAEEACRRGLAHPAPEQEGALRLCLLQVLLRRGDRAAAKAQAMEAAASVRLSSADRARLLAWSSVVPLAGGDLEEALGAAVAAEGMARQAGDAPAEVRALCTRASVATDRLQLATAEVLSARAVALAEADLSREGHDSLPHLARAVALVEADRPAEALEALGRGRLMAERLGARARLARARLVGAHGLVSWGRWDEALIELEAGAALAEETATTWPVAGRALCALIVVHRAGPTAPEAWPGEDGRPDRELGPMNVNAWARAAWLDASGHRLEALEELRRATQAWRGAGAALGDRVLGLPLARLAAASGQPAWAAAVADGLEARAGANPGVASLLGAARWARALSRDDPDLFLAALDAYRASPRRTERVAATEDAACCLARAGWRAEAEAAALEALALWGDLGADWAGARARARFREAGLSLGVRGPRRRPSTGWAALSPAEARVAALVADGLSNPDVAARLVVSRRTVETHVSHILARLGLRSRVELAAQVPRAAQDLREEGQ